MNAWLVDVLTKANIYIHQSLLYIDDGIESLKRLHIVAPEGKCISGVLLRGNYEPITDLIGIDEVVFSTDIPEGARQIYPDVAEPMSRMGIGSNIRINIPMFLWLVNAAPVEILP